MNSSNAERSELNARGFLLLAVPLLLYGAVNIARGYDWDMMNAVAPLGPLMLGAGFYLVYAGGAARIAGATGLILLAAISGLRAVIVPAFTDPYWAPQWGPFFSMFIWALLTPGAVAILAVVAASKKDEGRSFKIYSLWAGLAVLFIGLFGIFVIGPGRALFHDFNAFACILLGALINVPALTLFALLAKDFCRTGGLLFRPSVWGRLWCGFVVAVTVVRVVSRIFRTNKKLAARLGLDSVVNRY